MKPLAIGMFSTSVDGLNLKFAEVPTTGSEHHLLLEKTVSLSPVSESSPPLAATITKITSNPKEIRSESNTGMKKQPTISTLRSRSYPAPVGDR
jgi:hypothetical protein